MVRAGRKPLYGFEQAPPPEGASSPFALGAAGQGSRPLTTAYATSASTAAFSLRRVSSMARCSDCAESVIIAPASSRPMIDITTASSTSVNAACARRVAMLVVVDHHDAVVEGAVEDERRRARRISRSSPGVGV